jgi:hypothetical protein
MSAIVYLDQLMEGGCLAKILSLRLLFVALIHAPVGRCQNYRWRAFRIFTATALATR